MSSVKIMSSIISEYDKIIDNNKEIDRLLELILEFNLSDNYKEVFYIIVDSSIEDKFKSIKKSMSNHVKIHSEDCQLREYMLRLMIARVEHDVMMSVLNDNRCRLDNWTYQHNYDVQRSKQRLVIETICELTKIVGVTNN